jgi:fatty acyl-CoA reductase
MGDIVKSSEGKTFFVAGGPGFLGKVLIEKILWELPQIRRIFLLVRPHTADNAEFAANRQREMFRSRVFDRLRARHGQGFGAFVAEKIKLVQGDIAEPDLALGADAVEVLGADVDWIINLAASVKFHERLDRAISSNTIGPRNLLKLAKQFRNAKLLHVSTAFVSGRRTGLIREEVLQPDVCAFEAMGIACADVFRTQTEIDRVLRLAETVDVESRTRAAKSDFRHAAVDGVPPNQINKTLEAAAERNRQRWVDNVFSREGVARARGFGWIDTYTFTKALGEQLLVQCNDGVPIVILRPSVIESSLSAPEPGWIEGFRMTSPILFGYGSGELPDFPARSHGIIDLIPVDFVVSAMIAALTLSPERPNPTVLQVGSGYDNPLRWSELMQYTEEYFRRMPLHATDGPIVPQRWRFRSPDEFNGWLRMRQRISCIALNACDWLYGWPGTARVRRGLRATDRYYKRLRHLADIYGDYTHLDCCFRTENTRGLFQSLTRDDQMTFFFDPTGIDWPTYIQGVQLPGVRRHVMKQREVKCGTTWERAFGQRQKDRSRSADHTTRTTSPKAAC